jgi:hypothetical protein
MVLDIRHNIIELMLMGVYYLQLVFHSLDTSYSRVSLMFHSCCAVCPQIHFTSLFAW